MIFSLYKNHLALLLISTFLEPFFLILSSSFLTQNLWDKRWKLWKEVLNRMHWKTAKNFKKLNMCSTYIATFSSSRTANLNHKFIFFFVYFVKYYVLVCPWARSWLADPQVPQPQVNLRLRRRPRSVRDGRREAARGQVGRPAQQLLRTRLLA